MESHVIEERGALPPCLKSEVVRVSIPAMGQVDICRVPEDCRVLFKTNGKWWLAKNGAPLMVDRQRFCLSVHSEYDRAMLMSPRVLDRIGRPSDGRPELRVISEDEAQSFKRTLRVAA